MIARTIWTGWAKRRHARRWKACAAILSVLSVATAPLAKGAVSVISIDYPADQSIFPPEITAPTFLWRDPVVTANFWKLDIAFADGSTPIHVTSRGERMRIGRIDPDCISKSNELPQLTPTQRASRTWTPGALLWASIKKHSVAGAASVTITGYAQQLARAGNSAAISRGQVIIRTSKDPVSAPIFYRDVPLMPTETEKGQIKPLAPQALPLVNWRLRAVGERTSRLLLSDMPVCANCHSFSADGKTMGMDLDGLQNNKGQYFLTSVKPEISVARQDVIQWRSEAGRLQGNIRAGFMSQVSPDGQFVATTINPAELDAPQARAPRSNYYVTNYRDYRFLQVFFPTRGILAWYSRATGKLQPLPGADDPRFVQMTAVWSPDGQYLVFARAAAQEPNPEAAPPAIVANDSNERQIRYDLYRIPFDHGKGGMPEPLAGAAGNGMSNTFPKVSPDGKWVVYVQCRNGQLMRPDSQLYIVPAAGGTARRMRCNTPLMNSWHSFSPNGRWLVFSSKGRSPYTQMYLTHIDEDGNDSPAILIENATAANRAVNLPEFVNVAPDGVRKLGGPAIDFYKSFNRALFLQKRGRLEESAVEWARAIEDNPEDPLARDNFGMILLLARRREEAGRQIEKARELRLRNALNAVSGKAAPHNELGVFLLHAGRSGEALAQFRKAVEIEPGNAAAHCHLGETLVVQQKLDDAISEFERALALDSRYAPALYHLGSAQEKLGRPEAAIASWRQALALNPSYADAHLRFAHALSARGNEADALEHWRAGLQSRPNDFRALQEAAWVLATSSNTELRNGREALAFAVRALQLAHGRGPTKETTVEAATPDASYAGETHAGEASPRNGSLHNSAIPTTTISGYEAAALDTLAAAYAECGRFTDAVSTARRALVAEPSPRAGEIKARIRLYERQLPFHRQSEGGPPGLIGK
jgi:tetratricopeptide (TPR) repeat protein